MAEIQNKSEAVKNLQRYLRRLSFEENGPARVAIDGVFGDATEKSLTDFQRLAGLERSGRADRETWDALFAEYRALRQADEAAERYSFPENPRGHSVQIGERSLTASVIRLMLRELALIYDSFEEITVGEVYDEATARAIRDFQRINLLEETGEVDAETYARLADEYRGILNIYS